MSFTGSKPLDQAIAGFTAGTVSTLTLHPFDVVKTRLQVSAQKTTISEVLKSLSKQGIRGFYRGIGPNLGGSSLSWALYFFWYSNIKDYLKAKRDLDWLDYLGASAAAGMLTSLVANPIFVVKTRMLVQSQSNYSGLFGILY